MGGISVQQLPKRDVCGGRDQRASNRSAIEPRLLHIAGLAGVGSLVGFATQDRVASRFVGVDRRHERPQVILGVGASTPGSRTSITRIVLRMSFLRPCSHEIWHRSTYRRTRFACATHRQARGVARASRFRHGRPDALAGCAGRMRRHEDQRCLRSAAWPARRQARQHDRVCRTSTIRCMASRSSASMETCASRPMR